jgi:hypothetical protein
LPQKTLTFAFLNIGEYRLFIQRTHPISGNQERLSFHCAIRNSEELLTERLGLGATCLSNNYGGLFVSIFPS